MKRRRWLAMAMAVVMTASSIPAGTFTAFAAEEEVWVDSADIDQQEEAIVEDNILAEEASYGGDLLFAEDLLLEDETDSDFFEEGILQDDSAVFEDGFSEDNFDEEDIEPEFDMEITDDVLEDGFLPEAEDAEETIDELDGMVEEETAPEEEEASVEDDIIAEPEEDIGDLEEAAAVDRMALDFSAAQVLQIGVPVAVEISEPGERILFSFTPEEDGTYVFRSSDIESGDPMGYLYDGDGNELIEVDDYGLQGMNFWIIYDLEEGETYYLEASENGEDDPASYMVSVIKRDLTLPESSYSFSVSPGETLTLTAVATASTNLTYRWYRDSYYFETFSTEAEITITPEKSSYWFCEVSDETGDSLTISYDVKIDNAFDARAAGADEDNPHFLSQTVAPGTEVILQVEAEAANGGFTYQWYDNWNLMDGEENASLTVTADVNGYYICRVEDAYGNIREVYFDIYIENEFDAWAVGADEEDPYNLSQTVTPGTEVTLQVEAETTSGDITYQWYDDNWNTMEGEENASLTVVADQYSYYICRAYDVYGNSRDVNFYIYIENEFDAWAVGADEDDPYYLSQTVTPGTEVTLQVEAETASGDITYQWYDDDENMMEGEESASLTVVADKSSYYRCYVYDAYGNSREIEFYIQIDNAFDVRAVGANTYDPLNLYKTVAPEEEITLEVEASAAEGEIAYQWLDDDENEIEGETNASYTVTAEVSTRYICQVSDDYGNYQNVYFYITVDNAFSAHAKDYITDYYVKRGSDLDLWVEASCERGELHYAWYYEDDYEEDLIDLDVTENVLHLVDIEEERAYYCRVSDDYGNNNSIWFYVYFPTELTLSYNDYYDVLPGEGVHLEIIAASPDESTPITYLWYIWDDDEEEWTIIEGETGSGLDITPTGYEEYRCVVTQGEDVRTAYIEVDVSSGLSASAERSTIEAAVGDTVQLKVNAESRLPQINYKWYKNTIEDENLLEEDTDTLEIVLQDVMEIYHCEVTDGYATERITISVIDSSAVEAAPSMESAIEIHTGETKMVRVEDGGAVWLKFVPENDGTYAFFSGSSADTYGYLLDASGSETISSDDDGGENDNFRIETDLYAGTTYYIRARMYDNDAGVFPVTAELISLENGFYAEAKSGPMSRFSTN